MKIETTISKVLLLLSFLVGLSVLASVVMRHPYPVPNHIEAQTNNGK